MAETKANSHPYTNSTAATTRALSYQDPAELKINEKRGAPGNSGENVRNQMVYEKKLAPTFSDRMVMDRLLYYIKNTKAPVGTYEVRLYELCRRKQAELDSKLLTCDCIEKMHPLMKLKKRADLLSISGKEKLDQLIQEELGENPNAIVEYNVCKRTLKFCSDYIAKFGQYTIDGYNYRTAGRTMNIKPLDMMELNKSLLTMETVWLSFAIKSEPFSLIVDEATMQYSLILRSTLNKVLAYIYQLNQVDFKAHPKIESLVAAKDKTYRKLTKNFVKQEHADAVEYQRLKVPISFFGLCIRTAQQRRALSLRNLLKELEIAYRSFEKSLVAHCLRMQSPIAISD